MVKYAREPANGPKSCKVRAPLPAATAHAVRTTAAQTRIREGAACCNNSGTALFANTGSAR